VHDNLRSIGLAVNHLRGLERHGGATMMERAFSGFAALPPPNAGQRERSWREVFGYQEGMTPSRGSVESRYRALAKERHPDAGGNMDSFVELGAARAAALQEIGE